MINPDIVLLKQRLRGNIRREQLNKIKSQIRKSVRQNEIVLCRYQKSHQCKYCLNQSEQSNNQITNYANFHETTLFFLGVDHNQLAFPICIFHQNKLIKEIIERIMRHPILMNLYIKSNNKNKIVTLRIYVDILSHIHDEQYGQILQSQLCKNQITRDVLIYGLESQILTLPCLQNSIAERYYERMIIMIMNKIPMAFIYYSSYSNCIQKLMSLNKSRINIALLQGQIAILQLIVNSNHKLEWWFEQKIEVSSLVQRFQNIVLQYTLRQFKFLTLQELSLLLTIINILSAIQPITISTNFFNKIIKWMNSNIYNCTNQDISNFYSNLLQRLTSIANLDQIKSVSTSMDIQNNQS